MCKNRDYLETDCGKLAPLTDITILGEDRSARQPQFFIIRDLAEKPEKSVFEAVRETLHTWEKVCGHTGRLRT